VLGLRPARACPSYARMGGGENRAVTGTGNRDRQTGNGPVGGTGTSKLSENIEYLLAF
jgi:hypothetical protein